MKSILAIIAAGLIFLAAAFMLYNPAPPAGKTADFVAESSQNSSVSIEEQSISVIELVEETDESDSETENASETAEASQDDEVRTGVAILRPSADKMIALSVDLPYTEDELVYWNNLALEHGLMPFDGTGDFYLFTQAVQQAINQASIDAEPVYEEPVYEEPVYEEPVYEEPIYETPEPETPGTEIPGTEEPDDSFDPEDVYPYNNGSSEGE